MRSEPADTGGGQLLIAWRKRQLPHLHPVKQPPQHLHDLGNDLPERLGIAGAPPSAASGLLHCRARRVAHGLAVAVARGAPKSSAKRFQVGLRYAGQIVTIEVDERPCASLRPSRATP